MNNQLFEILFRERPEMILEALNAIKHVTAENAQHSQSTREKDKWDSIYYHVLKTHGVTSLLFKAN